MKSCQHVVSRDLKFIRESQYNRASFVVCIREAFSGFASDGEMTIYEFSSFIALLFQGFSVHFIEHFAAVLEPTHKSDNPSLIKYNISHLQQGLFFTILYENWLNELCAHSDTKTGKKIVDLQGVFQWLKMFQVNGSTREVESARNSMSTPNCDVLIALVEEFMDIHSDSEMSLNKFKRSLFLNSQLQREIVTRLPRGNTFVTKKLSSSLHTGIHAAGGDEFMIDSNVLVSNGPTAIVPSNEFNDLSLTDGRINRNVGPKKDVDRKSFESEGISGDDS